MTGLELSEPSIDEIVAGKYRLTRLIGRGGMGSVWEGTHVTLDTRVAVKFIDPACAESPEARQRFENEARAAARLNSKYAVQVYDHGMMPDGRPFIVMEYLVGEPLDARLDREGQIPLTETARILSQVCRALSRAHAAGIVHRDLKPENVFLVWDDEDQANVAKVVDFGIAKFTDKQAGISSSTRTGSVLGTPYYMSPEQARGLRTVDFRTDIWSLGVIAYRCVVGRLPFDGESIGDLLVKICTAPLPIPTEVAPGCPREFDAWFARALKRDPNERFASAQELADQLMLACGLGAGRPPFPSESLGSAGDFAQQGRLYLSGNATPGAAVPGITAQPILETAAAFAQTNPNAKSTKRTLIWLAAGASALVAVTAVVVSFVIAGPSAKATAAQDQALASGAAAPPLPTQANANGLAAPPALASSRREAERREAEVGTAEVAGADQKAAKVDVTPVRAVPTAAASIQPPTARTPAAQARQPLPRPPVVASPRPAGPSRPIDVGY